MNTKFKIGDKVLVKDPALMMLQVFALPGSKPNNIGFVNEILDDGYLMIEFPIGDDDIKEHSQVAPYSESICVIIPTTT